jgi:hypothetical protein
MTYLDRFGCLPSLKALSFEGGNVCALSEATDAREWITRYAHSDGYVYPPCANGASGASVFLWRLPATHEISINSAGTDLEEPRYSVVGFVVHLLGLLYGQRCQFHDWWIDGRASVAGQTDHASPADSQVARCVDRALTTWRGWDSTAKLIAINVLFLHARTVQYQHEWERFQAEYQVVDGLYSLAFRSRQMSDRMNGRKRHHGERLEAICHTYGLSEAEERFKYFVKLRNALLHDALWDGRMPGEARSQESFYASLSLHQLSRRAAFAILGMRGDYIASPWWHLGSTRFDLESRASSQAV